LEREFWGDESDRDVKTDFVTSRGGKRVEERRERKYMQGTTRTRQTLPVTMDEGTETGNRVEFDRWMAF